MLETPDTYSFDDPAVGDQRALAGMRQAIQEGTPWYLALLDAIALWSSGEESFEGETYRYLIANEAFDWLRLAERLCGHASDLIPSAEVERLLFQGQPPIELDDEEFRRRIGGAKYRAHLNFFYGVTVEQALILAVEEELRKEALCGTLTTRSGQERGDPYERLYNVPLEALLVRFRTEQELPSPTLPEISLDEFQAFTYWLFKYRLAWTDKARVASDTKKGLTKLQQARRFLPSPQPAPEELVPASA